LKNSQGVSAISSTSPTGNPFGKIRSIPEVTILSHTATSAALET
jgi:hypothetical protein